MKRAIFIDSFSGALGDIPRKQHGDIVSVLHVLSKEPRFSCFDASATQKIARTMDALKARSLIVYDNSEGYPWCKAILTDAGRALLGASIDTKPKEAA